MQFIGLLFYLLQLTIAKKIFGHGWTLSEDKKMSKSLGNILDPIEVIKDYGIDQLRYYLIKEVSLENDGSISMNNLKTALITILLITMGIYVKEFFHL